MQSKRHSKQNLDHQDYPQNKGDSSGETGVAMPSSEILALFRLLVREPPPGHDFKTCPDCKRYGITGI
jgi:hypothetical protein